MSANYDNNTLHMNYGDENQNTKKPKKGNKIIIVVLVLVLVALIAAAVVIFVLPKLNNGNQNNNEIIDANSNEISSDVITAKKLNNDLFYVYDSPYLPQSPAAEGYFIGNDYYDVNNIVVPYINIESTSATDANNKIHAFYDEAVTKYNEYAATKNTFIKVDYKYFMNKNVLSILVERIEGGNSVPQSTY